MDLRRNLFPTLLLAACLIDLSPFARADCKFTFKTTPGRGVVLQFINKDNARLEFYHGSEEKPFHWLECHGSEDGKSEAHLWGGWGKGDTFEIWATYKTGCHIELQVKAKDDRGYIFPNGVDVLTIDNPGLFAGDKAKLKLEHKGKDPVLRLVDDNTVETIP